MLVGYGVVSFTVLQVVEPIQHALGLSDAALKMVVVLLGVGFPVSLVLAWAFDINPAGIERTPPAAAPALRGPRLVLLLCVAGALLAAPGVFWVFLRGSRSAAATPPVSLEAVAPAAAAPSIAVLPLVNMSSDKEQEYFSDGLTEELLNLLAQVPQLRVIARTSSFSFKGKSVDVATIARTLDVANILEGSVRRSGNKLRVTAQLIRAADSSHLWSQTYDRELTDVFTVQDEIAGAVVAALKVQLLPSQRVASAHRSSNTEAYEQYLLGREIIRRGSFGDVGRAVAVLQHAVALDPGFAAAYSLLGAAQVGLGEFAETQQKRVATHRLALANIDEAIAIDPGLADAYETRGWYRCNIAMDFRGGEEDLARALARGGADPYQQTGLAGFGGGHPCFRPSRVQEALAFDRKLVAADPLSMPAWQFYGSHLLLVPGARQQAREALLRAIDLSPDAGWPRALTGFLDLQDGNAEAALGHFRRAGPGLGEAGTAMAEHTLGHEREAQAALDVLKTRYAAGMAIQVAWVHAWRGENDLAFEWLERAAAQHDAGIVRLRYDPPLASLRSDPRFAALVQKIGLPE